MKGQEKRVLDLAKRYVAEVKKAQAQERGNEADDQMGSLPGRILETRGEELERLYNAAADTLQNLEDAVEPLLEFVPLKATHRALYREYADTIDILIHHLARLRNAYRGLSNSDDTPEDFDRWDSEIIGEENALTPVEMKIYQLRNNMNSI